jgi:hypothetical protein
MERLQTNALRKIAVIQALFVGLVLAMVSSANADWINLTGAQSAPNLAEIHVNDDHVRLVLEIFIKDLDKFINSFTPAEAWEKENMDYEWNPKNLNVNWRQRSIYSSRCSPGRCLCRVSLGRRSLFAGIWDPQHGCGQRGGRSSQQGCISVLA